MKSIIATIITLNIIASTAYGQIDSIQSRVRSLYFGVPASSEKFDIRLIFNQSENFYDYSEYKKFEIDNISVKFEQNLKMNFLGTKNELKAYFDVAGAFDQIVITSEYQSFELSKCQKQINEIVNMFKDISFKMNPSGIYNDNKELIGRGYHFYATDSFYKIRKAYMSLSYSERALNKYIIQLYFYPDALK